MIIAFSVVLIHEPHFLQQIGANGGAHYSKFRLVRSECDFNKFPKSRAVVITQRFGVSKTLQDGVGLQNAIFNADGLDGAGLVYFGDVGEIAHDKFGRFRFTYMMTNK